LLKLTSFEDENVFYETNPKTEDKVSQRNNYLKTKNAILLKQQRAASASRN